MKEKRNIVVGYVSDCCEAAAEDIFSGELFSSVGSHWIRCTKCEKPCGVRIPRHNDQYLADYYERKEFTGD